MSTRALRIYRLLLRLLPAPFRRDSGADLEAVLVDRLRDADGAASRAWIWLVALVDVAMTAAAEWTRIVRERQTGHVGRSVGSSDLGLDIRHAIRSLARRPGFAATAVATLALAIGATVAIFSVADAVLLRSLPCPDAERIVPLSQP